MKDLDLSRRKDLSRFDCLDSTVLQNILYEDSYLAVNDKYSFDEILYITELLAKRDEDKGIHNFTDNESAWKNFCEYYRPK